MTRPGRLPITIEKNHTIDRAVALSGNTPISPNKTTKAPSLRPMPEIVTGIREMMDTTGTKHRKDTNGAFMDLSIIIVSWKVKEKILK